MNVLVTGGAGYIGTHILIELLHQNHTPIVVDNFCNSKPEALKRVGKITNKPVTSYQIDCADKVALSKVFEENKIDAVIHLAGLKAVGESVQKPLLYYRNNIDTTLSVCEVMQEHGVTQLIFSSSATVYGAPEELPLKETSRVGVGITNPYGQTKFMLEQVLIDLAASDPSWQITLLRYFNPVGADASGLIGEDPSDIPNNILPYISQVAVGKLDELKVFGDDYDTSDGTGVRDYIHVADLARGHIAALARPPQSRKTAIYNLSTGVGTSVLELLQAFELACNKKLPHKVVDRRPGDIAACYADATKADQELGWKAEKTIAEACADAWRWQSANPNGL